MAGTTRRACGAADGAASHSSGARRSGSDHVDAIIITGCAIHPVRTQAVDPSSIGIDAVVPKIRRVRPVQYLDIASSLLRRETTLSCIRTTTVPQFVSSECILPSTGHLSCLWCRCSLCSGPWNRWGRWISIPSPPWKQYMGTLSLKP
jgi:hypothetical protein